MAVNKIIYGNSTLIDLESDTVDASDVMYGKTFHDRAGVLRTGTMNIADFVDVFYPVGSYYETSDSTFDPNNAWGGTWSLETSGQVHVSAGTGYTIGATGGAVSNSYTPAGSVNNHKLTTSEIPKHTHGSKTLTGTFTAPANTVNNTSNSHRFTATGICAASHSGNSAAYVSNASTNTSYTGNNRVTITATHEHDNVGGDGNHNHGWTGTAADISTMQPYIVVNRWHRTA